jgi:hypothetical protein
MDSLKRLPKKEYCVIGVEIVEGLKDDIISMSTGVHKIIEANNMIVITFESYMTPKEMKVIIEETEDRTYFLFELNQDTAAVKIHKKDVNDYLFSSMKSPQNPLDIISTKFGHMGINNLNEELKEQSSELYSKIITNENKISEILETIKDAKNKSNDEYSEDELNSYTKAEQNDLINKLLDKAPDLTEEDKKVLDFLVNKKD